MSRPPGVDDFEYRGRKDGLLLAECWCQGDMVLVRPEDIRAGLTGSCGEDWCGPERPELRLTKSDSGGRVGVARRSSVTPGIETARRHVTAPGRWSAPRRKAPTP